ncbi:MAG: N-acetylmuramoyl-L-alanine amidase [Ruthenibacterium lactatiformans]
MSRPKAGDKERPACSSRGLTDIRPCPARAPCAAHVRRRAAAEAPQAAHTGACLPDAGHRAAGRAAPDVRCPARRDGGGAGQSAALPTAAAPHEGPPYTIAIDAGHGGTDIGAEGVINEIQLTEATIGYLEGWLTQDENYTSVRTHAADTFSKNTERAAACKQRRRFAAALVHGNSDPYSSDSYGSECIRSRRAHPSRGFAAPCASHCR